MSVAAPQRVVIRTNEYASGVVDQAEIFIGGAWYRRDVSCGHDVLLTERMARDSGVELEDYRTDKSEIPA